MVGDQVPLGEGLQHGRGEPEGAEHVLLGLLVESGRTTPDTMLRVTGNPATVRAGLNPFGAAGIPAAALRASLERRLVGGT